ncbi:MAG: M48 family metallopeptidase [Minisyncoccota bacterium]
MEYTIKKNKRSKGIRISVHIDGRVLVTAPKIVPNKIVEFFVNNKKKWIEERINIFLEKQKSDELLGLPKRMTPIERKKDFKIKKEEARKIIIKRVIELNKYYNFKFNSISIKDQKTRWGSCSKTGNLNFNYQVAFLPQEMTDYVVVHELCHLGEFNHSKNFWNLVAQTIPDHVSIRNKFKKIGLGRVIS